VLTVNHRNDPDDVVLSPTERLALREIERRLDGDRHLARRMRGPRPALGLWLPLSVAVLSCASLFLIVMGIRTSDPVVIWCFALLWPLTLLQAFRLLCRVTRLGDRVTSWR
jgi:hypothetical protein